MRLIDGDNLYELIDGGFDLDFDEMPETKAELLEMISKQETVCAVPVVRCLECKYWDRTYQTDGKHHCPVVWWATEPDWFCASGERKENNEE